ncbi:Flp pilus assembly complex ATPase component TadA, partial [Candidatus Aerophobetes bacterium]|nr:Flp pilus assembly complex ATPase component TadA [Candidatus Aerophobetes bacterium]
MLVTGPSGCGKSTTLATMIDIINRERDFRIITIEDPIEYIHPHKRAVVEQIEIGSDSPSFASALKYAVRQDPDVIMVGEMRDLETISMAITAAETGHLVFASLHTPDAPQSISRIIDVFPSQKQNQIRSQLSLVLKNVISQQLLPRKGGGLVPVCEILKVNSAV